VVLTRGHMQRRQFITFIGGATAACPIATRAQPTHSVPKVGWLTDQNRQLYLRRAGSGENRLREISESGDQKLSALAPMRRRGDRAANRANLWRT
jgi:hypothetical protein